MAVDTEVELLTPEQVSELTGLSQNTLANWRSKGGGPHWEKPVGAIGRTGGTVVYPRDAVDQWLATERGMTAEQMRKYLAARLARRERAAANRSH